jgi:diguanylate cyclase (GGDEF)-like protein
VTRLRLRRPQIALGALVAGWLVFALHTVTGAGGHGIDAIFDRGLCNALDTAAALAIIARATTRRADRGPWLLIGVGALGWAVHHASVAGSMLDAHAASGARLDASSLICGAALLAGMLLLLRDQLRGLRHDLVLDGLLAGTASIAVITTLAQPWLNSVAPSPTALNPNLSLPMLDLLMLMVAITAAVINGWRQARAWLLVALAMLMLTIADTLALYESVVASGAGRNATSLLWPASVIVLAIAAWQPARMRPRAGSDRSGAVAVPASAVVGAVLVLAYGDAAHVSFPAAGLAVIALVIAVVRMCLMVRENATMLVLVQRQAKTDALTGLDNRRSLLETIDRDVRTATEAEPLLLVFYDLNGFKQYNDTFGHLAGDSLLARFGAKLRAAIGEHGRAYRVGGDEFCAVLRCAPAIATLVIDASVQALSEHGPGFDVTTAHGVVRVPSEAQDSFQALHLADQRLYELKEVRPGSAKHQLRDVLLQAVRERQPALDERRRDVAELAREVGRRLGLPSEQLNLIAAAAELHDVGKIAISDTILDKPGPLDPDEWERMRHHTVLGERILAAAPALRPVAALVRSSHERFDGFGYPDGLAGEEIPVGARVISVCAAYEAMTADRAYRSGLDGTEALRRLRRHAGSQFDPRVVDAFTDVIAGRPPPSHDRAEVPSPAH